ncbi:Vacuolar import and degradation protein 27 [Vermiconidia calcicola]|uniref:Vacuolar import and degradation protein 27 n=1 Tax=Vermiconidia calcicola TaxID=1690605 RepID=A0ACC3N952_9PEZI|nr:Vacuolar import and degradation protein 27 [Vermiconidia calcicola]
MSSLGTMPRVEGEGAGSASAELGARVLPTCVAQQAGGLRCAWDQGAVTRGDGHIAVNARYNVPKTEVDQDYELDAFNDLVLEESSLEDSRGAEAVEENEEEEEEEEEYEDASDGQQSEHHNEAKDEDEVAIRDKDRKVSSQLAGGAKVARYLVVRDDRIDDFEHTSTNHLPERKAKIRLSNSYEEVNLSRAHDDGSMDLVNGGNQSPHAGGPGRRDESL